MRKAHLKLLPLFVLLLAVGCEEEDPANVQRVTLMEFYSDSCPPCQRQKPIIHRIEGEYSNLRVRTVDTVFEPRLVKKYQVSKIPTILIFADGKSKKRLVGFQSYSRLTRSLEKIGARRRGTY